MPPAFTAHLLGVRGSTPAPGVEFVRFGGHTSCVALHATGEPQPDLLLDAGTGARDLGALLRTPFRGDVLLTHLHWDHTHGLPFAAALLDQDARVRIVAPTGPGVTALDALRPGISPPSFPVPVDQLSPGWSFASAVAESTAGAWRIRTAPIAHKGGVTLGIRVDLTGRSLVYMPDHDLREPDPAAVALAEGADVLLHDAQYLAGEIARFSDYGHSTIDRASAFAAEAGVRHLVLTHHAPSRTDNELDAIEAEFAESSGDMRITVARQGARIVV